MERLNIDDVKNETATQDFETLTLGDDAVAERCLMKARIWAKGAIRSTGGEYDEDNDAVRLAVLKMTMYELFSFIGEEQKAQDKYRDAVEILKSYFGKFGTKYDSGTAPNPAVAVIKKNGAERSGPWA